MRKGIYAIVVVLYLLLSSGVVLQLHYCMDRLAEIGLFTSDHKDVCDDCGMDMDADNDCCHDRTDVIKLVQDQTYQAGSFSLSKVNITELPASLSIPDLVHHSQNDSPLVGSGPPDPLHGRYRYRALRVIRI
jgi:hypothetical protein